MGIQLDLKLRTDATAAMGMCRRLGVGKIRHLAVADLWIQDKVRSGDVLLEKVLGKDNPADLLTKHLDFPTMSTHLNFLNLHSETGRPQSAPALTIRT